MRRASARRGAVDARQRGAHQHRAVRRPQRVIGLAARSPAACRAAAVRAPRAVLPTDTRSRAKSCGLTFFADEPRDVGVERALLSISRSHARRRRDQFFAASFAPVPSARRFSAWRSVTAGLFLWISVLKLLERSLDWAAPQPDWPARLAHVEWFESWRRKRRRRGRSTLSERRRDVAAQARTVSARVMRFLLRCNSRGLYCVRRAASRQRRAQNASTRNADHSRAKTRSGFPGLCFHRVDFLFDLRRIAEKTRLRRFEFAVQFVGARHAGRQVQCRRWPRR